MKKLKWYPVLLLSVWIITSCEKEKHIDEQSFRLTKGVFVVNEGAFNSSTGDISFFADDGSYQSQNLFFLVNKRPLGDVVQSMTIINNKGYLVVNNSQKIEVVNMGNFMSTGVINGLSSPRYMIKIADNVAYVSDWISDNIKIINLNTLAITGTIPTGNGPEKMLLINNKVYVTNVGGFVNDSTITVINTLNNSVETTMMVGVNPNSLIEDTTGILWVLCGGSLGPDYLSNTADDIGGKLLKIDLSTNTVINTFDFAQGEHPIKLTMNADKTKLYFLRGISSNTGSVCSMDINAIALPATSIINREFYGLGINPFNSTIYGGIGSFSTNSWMLHYESDGTLIDSMQVGIGPNGFVFN